MEEEKEDDDAKRDIQVLQMAMACSGPMPLTMPLLCMAVVSNLVLAAAAAEQGARGCKKALWDTVKISTPPTCYCSRSLSRALLAGLGCTPRGPCDNTPLRRVLETVFEKVLRRVLRDRRCLALGSRGRKGIEKGSKKGPSRRHLEGRNSSFREYDSLGVRPRPDVSSASGRETGTLHEGIVELQSAVFVETYIVTPPSLIWRLKLPWRVRVSAF